MKTIAIEINGILRDFKKMFRNIYTSEYSYVELNHNILDEKLNDFNIPEFFTHFEGSITDFIEEYMFELFAKSERFEDNEHFKRMHALFTLKQMGYRIILFSKEAQKTRPLTMYYIGNLSQAYTYNEDKFTFYFDELRFFDLHDDILDYYFDFVITTNQNIITSKKLPDTPSNIVYFKPNTSENNLYTTINDFSKLLDLIKQYEEM
jgi:hypothetical protein